MLLEIYNLCAKKTYKKVKAIHTVMENINVFGTFTKKSNLFDHYIYTYIYLYEVSLSMTEKSVLPFKIDDSGGTLSLASVYFIYTLKIKCI